ATAEQVAEDVPEATGERAGVEASAAEAGERAAAAVVLLALLGIREHIVGLRDLLEALLRSLVARVAVRVVLARQLAVSLLDLLIGGALAYPEGLVVVGPGCHLMYLLAGDQNARGPDHGIPQPAS